MGRIIPYMMENKHVWNHQPDNNMCKLPTYEPSGCRIKVVALWAPNYLWASWVKAPFMGEKTVTTKHHQIGDVSTAIQSSTTQGSIPGCNTRLTDGPLPHPCSQGDEPLRWNRTREIKIVGPIGSIYKDAVKTLWSRTLLYPEVPIGLVVQAKWSSQIRYGNVCNIYIYSYIIIISILYIYVHCTIL